MIKPYVVYKEDSGDYAILNYDESMRTYVKVLTVERAELDSVTWSGRGDYLDRALRVCAVLNNSVKTNDS